jgi:hypothetical protein
MSGIVKVSQNGTWSNAVTFTVPPGSGTPVTIMPNVISMVIGDTRSIQALNSSSQPVTGLAWTSSNTAIATLSTDDPPIITAVTAGNVTITAGSASADLTVFPGSLPTGTIIWSNPGDGSGVKKIIPAVPSSTGVADVFALQTDGTVQAITSDGTVVWTANAGNTANIGNWIGSKKIVSDFQGGLVVADPGVLQFNVSAGSLWRLDGMTGQAYPVYTIPNTVGQSLPVAVHSDGTIFTVNGDSLVGVDPSTGTQKFSIPMTHSTFTQTYSNGQCSNSSIDVVPATGDLMIAGDGYAYVVYQYSNNSTIYFPNISNCNYDINSTTHNEHHARLLRVETDGKAHVDSKRRGHCSARIRTVGLDVDGSRFRGVGDLRETSLRVGKIQRAEVESVKGSRSHASAFGWLPPRMARENEVCQGKRLCVSQRKAEGQEAAVRVHHGAEILAPRSGQRRRDSCELEGTLRFSQLSPFTGDGTGEAESGPQNRAACSAARGFWHNDGTLCTVRHGLHAGCARQVPGTASGGQNSPAYRASSVRIMGWIVGWKFPPFATKFFGMMVARDGVEPPTPAFSGLRSTT